MTESIARYYPGANGMDRDDDAGDWVRHEDVRQIFYELFIALGNVSHVLGNHCDPERGNDLLEPIIDKLQELSK